MASPSVSYPIPKDTLDTLAEAVSFAQYTLDKNPLHTNDFASEAFRIGLFCVRLVVLYLLKSRLYMRFFF